MFLENDAQLLRCRKSVSTTSLHSHCNAGDAHVLGTRYSRRSACAARSQVRSEREGLHCLRCNRGLNGACCFRHSHQLARLCCAFAAERTCAAEQKHPEGLRALRESARNCRFHVTMLCVRSCGTLQKIRCGFVIFVRYMNAVHAHWAVQSVKLTA